MERWAITGKRCSKWRVGSPRKQTKEETGEQSKQGESSKLFVAPGRLKNTANIPVTADNIAALKSRLPEWVEIVGQPLQGKMVLNAWKPSRSNPAMQSQDMQSAALALAPAAHSRLTSERSDACRLDPNQIQAVSPVLQVSSLANGTEADWYEVQGQFGSEISPTPTASRPHHMECGCGAAKTATMAGGIKRSQLGYSLLQLASTLCGPQRSMSSGLSPRLLLSLMRTKGKNIHHWPFRAGLRRVHPPIRWTKPWAQTGASLREHAWKVRPGATWTFYTYRVTGHLAVTAIGMESHSSSAHRL
ncbi:hypothetical protein V8F33_001974 [Rhypophila sp. PSN 637]